MTRTEKKAATASKKNAQAKKRYKKPLLRRVEMTIPYVGFTAPKTIDPPTSGV